MLSDTMMLGGGRKAAYSIENSLLFRGGSYLSRTPNSVPTSGTKAAISWWGRLGGHLSSNRTIVSGHIDNSRMDVLSILFTGKMRFDYYDGVHYGVETSAVFGDVTGWLHVYCAVDTAKETASQRVRIWINGVEQALHPISGYIPQNALLYLNRKGVTQYVGYDAGGYGYFDGNMAELAIVDGVPPDVTDFGEFDPVTLNWRPKKLLGIAWGANGSCLGKPWSSSALGADYSGRDNTWTPTGLAATDVVADTPTNVYATMNPLTCGTYPTFSDGNLVLASTAGGDLSGGAGTILAAQGKWYWEVVVSGVNTYPYVGVATQGRMNASTTYGTTYEIAKRSADLEAAPVLLEGINLDRAGNQTWVSGDVVMAALDCGAGKLWFGKNGTWMNGGNPAAGSSPQATWSNRGVPMAPYVGGAVGQGNGSRCNFGQRPFAYAPPAGFKPLSTANLPATSGQANGSFTGNANADGPCIYTGAVPLTLTINNNPVTWGTHADRLATGFKIRTASTSYNSTGTNTWTATYDRKPTVGPKGRAPANAQGNP